MNPISKGYKSDTLLFSNMPTEIICQVVEKLNFKDGFSTLLSCKSFFSSKDLWLVLIKKKWGHIPTPWMDSIASGYKIYKILSGQFTFTSAQETIKKKFINLFKKGVSIQVNPNHKLKSWQAHSDYSEVLIDTQGNLALTAALLDSKIKIWNINKAELKNVFYTSTLWLLQIGLSGTSAVLALGEPNSSTSCKGVEVWDIENGSLISTTFSINEGRGTCAAIYQDSVYLIDEKQQLNICDLRSSQWIRKISLEQEHSWLGTLCVVNNEAIYAHQGSVLIVDLRKENAIRKTTIGNFVITGIDKYNDKIVFAGNNFLGSIFQEEINFFKMPNWLSPCYRQVKFIDSEFCILGGNDIELWDIKHATCIKVVKNMNVHQLSLQKDRVAVGNSKGNLILMNWEKDFIKHPK